MTWTKSSYSVDAANCVEVARDSDAVHIRNSTHPDRAALAFPSPAVAAFVRACATGELDDLASS
jgi:Domain of unknown function (DUF397)